MNKRLTSAALIGGILASVIYLEGDYSDDPDDPGGKTKYGITERVAREYGYTGSMEDLTQEKANEIYTELYIKAPGFDRILDLSPAVGHKLIDSGVNLGTMRIGRWFQELLNKYSLDGKSYPTIKIDGVVGEKTAEAYKNLEKARGKVKACELIIKGLDGYQATWYLSLNKYAKYTVGWIDNRIGNVPLSQCTEYNLSILNTGSHNENK